MDFLRFPFVIIEGLHIYMVMFLYIDGLIELKLNTLGMYELPLKWWNEHNFTLLYIRGPFANEKLEIFRFT